MQEGQNAAGMGSAAHLMDKEGCGCCDSALNCSQNFLYWFGPKDDTVEKR